MGYLDPPYWRRCRLYGHFHNPAGGRPFDGGCWDQIATHQLLVEWACDEFPDGWALSLSAESLPTMLEVCPRDVRVGAWVRGERAVRSDLPLSSWEPVIYVGGRAYPSPVDERRIDSLVHGVSPRLTDPARVIGAKPPAFSYWMFDLLGLVPGDELVDVFPGSGGVARAWAEVNRRAHQVDGSAVCRGDGSEAADHDGSAPAARDSCAGDPHDGSAPAVADA